MSIDIAYISSVLGCEPVPHGDGIAWFPAGDYGADPRLLVVADVIYVHQVPAHDVLATRVESVLLWAREQKITLGLMRHQKQKTARLIA